MQKCKYLSSGAGVANHNVRGVIKCRPVPSSAYRLLHPDICYDKHAEAVSLTLSGSYSTNSV